jgi:hypothetical protein
MIWRKLTKWHESAPTIKSISRRGPSTRKSHMGEGRVGLSRPHLRNSTTCRGGCQDCHDPRSRQNRGGKTSTSHLGRWFLPDGLRSVPRYCARPAHQWHMSLPWSSQEAANVSLYLVVAARQANVILSPSPSVISSAATYSPASESNW